MANVIGEYLSQTLEVSMQITKEPGSPLVNRNEDIREMIFSWHFDDVSQGLLFFIDHYRHAVWVEKKIKEGVSVVSDRWLYSQYAYQAVKEERQIDGNLLYRKYEDLQIKPDLVFILDCSGEVTKERLQGRTGKDVSQKDKAWGDHDRVDTVMREQYRDLYNEYKETQRGVFWIGQDSVVSPTEVFYGQIKREIDSWLEKRKEIEEVIDKLMSVVEKASSWVAMPIEVELHNANILCDMTVGACACGASHSWTETIGRIRELI